MARRFLSNVNVNDSYTLPSADGTNGQVIQTDGSGNLSFVDFASDEARKIIFTVKNKDSISLSKGTVVHASPSATPPSGNVIEVIRADNDDSTKMPAIGVLNETLAVDAEGECVMLGSVSGIATNSFNIGDELYVSDTPGEFTNTKPTGTSNLIQKIAIVIKSHSTNGLIEVFGAGRSNDVPNRIDRNVNFTDDSLLTFGNSTDLRIYHNSSNSSGNIWNTVGHLNIQNTADDSDIVFLSDDGAGGNAEYFRVDGGENRIVYSQSGRHLDNVISMYGSGADLQIKHDGFHSYISNNTGTLYIQQTADDSDIVFQSDNGSGGTSDYMSLDGSATRVNFFVDTRYSDGAKALFGGGGDLQIYHDGSNSYIVDSGTGDLYIRGASSIYIGNSAGTKSYISGTDGGSTNLFYNGSKKLETTSTGVKTTGEIVVDGTTSAFANSGITLKRTGVLTGDADILLAGTSGSEALAFRINDSEKVRIDSSGNLLVSKTSANNATVGNQFMTDGSANPTVDGDTVARFNRLTSDGEIIRLQKDTSTVGSIGSTTSYLNSSLGIGTTSPSEKLSVYGSVNNDDVAILIANTYDDNTAGSAPAAALILSAASNNGHIRLTGSPADVASEHILDIGSTATGNEITFTTQNTERVRIDASGNVGIGATDPLRNLHVAGDLAVNAATNQYYGVYINGAGEGANPSILIGDWHNSSASIKWDSAGNYLNIDSQHSSANSSIVFTGNDAATEYMRIDSSGNLGIGTTSPSYKLDVEHNSNATNGIQITNTNSGTSSRATVEFVSEDAQLNIYTTSSNYNGVASWADAGVLSTSSATSNGLIFNAQSGGIKFQISTAEKMRIDSSGNVGIGKTPSTWKLDVDSSDIYAASFDTSNNVGIVINGNNTTAAQIIGYSNSASTYNELHLRTNSTTTDGLYINSSGNVGIGTTSPSAKLTINTGTGTDSLRFEKDSQETYRIIHGTSGLYFTHPDSTALLFGLTQNGDITIHNNQSSQYVIFDNGTNSVGIGTTSPTEALDVNGNIKHTGLTMTSGTDVDQISTFDMTFQLTADTWTDTGIDGTDLATGTYAIQVFVDDNGAGGNHYTEYYSGIMSWYSGSTNSTVVDEIPLHRAGHAPNDGNIMLRTQRASGTDTHDLMLQIKYDRSHTLAMNGTDNRTITFKFRRLI